MKTLLVSVPVFATLAFGCTASDPDMVETELGSASQAVNAPITCAIQTFDGHYLTAVGGGGRTTDVLHTDATKIAAWERFTLVDTGEGAPVRYGFKTATGNYLTAVSGGGRIRDVMHSDATELRDWEKFTLESLSDGFYAIRTIKGQYLTATGAGGNVEDAIHSDATKVDDWEKFRFLCDLNR